MSLFAATTFIEFHSHLEKQSADAVVALGNNTFHGGQHCVRQHGALILGSEVVDIELHRLFYEFGFATAIICGVELPDFIERFGIEPQCKFAFVFRRRHSNHLLFLPYFSLKNRNP